MTNDGGVPSESPSITPLDATAYLAPEGFERELAAELGKDASPVVPQGRLFLAKGPPRHATWAANVWPEPVRIRFGSIAEGARALRGLGRNWACLPLALFRRAALLGEQLPYVAAKPLVFPSPPPSGMLGSWTLLGQHELLAAARCTSPFPNGEARFVEDKEGPPSRAYLKLWEALTLLGRCPGEGDRCVNLGSSPGGWTWALARLGAHVVSVDKAKLDPRVRSLPRVEARQMSAFALEPASERADWVFSDIVCYPPRLVAMVQRWLATHPKASFVVTIKFQGPTDMKPLEPLACVAGSRLLHLHHNKHELTWMKLGGE